MINVIQKRLLTKFSPRHRKASTLPAVKFSFGTRTKSPYLNSVNFFGQTSELDDSSQKEVSEQHDETPKHQFATTKCSTSIRVVAQSS